MAGVEHSEAPAASFPLPPDAAVRRAVADEVHARPYELLEAPASASYVAVLVDPDERAAERAHLVRLCTAFGVTPPPEDAIHFSADFPAFRLRWERHGEFSSFTALVRGEPAPGFARTAIERMPREWVSAIPGRTIVAAHARVLAGGDDPPGAEALAVDFPESIVVGARIARGAGFAFTDFRIREDGFSRFVLSARALTPRRTGRTLQRLFEIEAYRVMALLGLPVARSEGPKLSRMERELAALTDAIGREATRADARSDTASDETLLADLTALAARVEGTLASSQYRFGASRAYYELVRARTREIAEEPLEGLQTIEEFMSRRLAPAVATGESFMTRLTALSQRVARAGNLLSTRVDIARERQNQALLASMDRRARQQLRLQQTVEGLSIAAITYYAVGLLGYLVKPLDGVLPVGVSAVLAVAVPVVAGLVAMGLHRARRRIAG